MLKVRFLKSSGNIEDNANINHYADMSKSQFIDMYLPSHRQYQIVEESEKAHICICGTQHTDNSLLREDELNIFYTVENFSVGRTHYQHFNKFSRYDNPMIQLYIYNDVVLPTETTIPAIYQRIKYFNKLNDINSTLYYKKGQEFYNNMNTPFKEKKFCLFISQNLLNKNKIHILRTLSTLGQIDSLQGIAQNNPKLQTSNCYNSYELLKLFNRYKFIICVENSKTIGYITEKIFNIFLSKSIPIYDGDPNINDFIERNTYISFDNKITEKISLLMNNEELYNNMLNQKKTKELDYSFIDQNFDKLIKKTYK
tara:strand:- start:30752 stop:31687 length:936 start_codon:yes stop_codon:yes gene_type:complete